MYRRSADRRRNDEFAVDRNLANSRSIFTHALPFPFLSSFLFSFSSLFPLFPDLAARRWPSVLLPIPSSPPWPAVLLPIPSLCLPLPLSPSLPLLHGQPSSSPSPFSLLHGRRRGRRGGRGPSAPWPAAGEGRRGGPPLLHGRRRGGEARRSGGKEVRGGVAWRRQGREARRRASGVEGRRRGGEEAPPRQIQFFFCKNF